MAVLDAWNGEDVVVHGLELGDGLCRDRIECDHDGQLLCGSGISERVGEDKGTRKVGIV